MRIDLYVEVSFELARRVSFSSVPPLWQVKWSIFQDRMSIGFCDSITVNFIFDDSRRAFLIALAYVFPFLGALS